MKILSWVLRTTLGLLFMFSGIIKLIDPKGTAYKLQEYFTAFEILGNHYLGGFLTSFFPYLHSLSTLLSIGLPVLEVVLGFCFLIWYKPKTTLFTTFVLLLFFGFLTGYSAACNPYNTLGISCVTDCGCFGDFLKLKPIHSFYKDIVFLLLAIPLLFVDQNNKVSNNKRNDVAVIIVFILSISFGCLNHWQEPMIDFRPYKIGNNILEKMNDGIPAKVAYIMQKEGKEYTFDTYPKSKGYRFIKTVEVLPEKPATIHDFYLFDAQGNDVTNSILRMKNTFLVLKNTNECSEDDIKNINYILTKDKKIKIISNAPHTFGKLENRFMLDETVIKTIMRTSPGIWEINKGVVVYKESLKVYLANKNF